MPPSSERLLVPFRQELPHRPLAEAWRVLAAREPGVAFLDAGGDPGGDGARWSVLGWRPRRTLRWPAGRSGSVEGIRAFVGSGRLAPDPESPAPFRGGFLGWIGYDVGRDVERIPARNPPRPEVPEFVLGEYEALLVEDRRERRLFLSGTCDPDEGPSRLLARQQEALDAFEAFRAAPPEASPGPAAASVHPALTREEYLDRARRVLEYVHAGDVFQANLAYRFEGRPLVPPPEVYRRLREESPAPYGCFLSLGGPDVLSISPELFLERRGARVATEPIKGTRPRGADAAGDARLLAELEAAPKDRAELAMIVDLLRNDLGRVATTGSVRVEDARRIRTHPTLHHASARVTAHLGDSVHAADLLRATMPGGSVTGAPKVRAMEVLEELEDGRRGPYCGAAGWIGHDGDMVLNLLIRTVVVAASVVPAGAVPRVSFHVGGGIVADSSPEAEWEETRVKARALLRALGGGEV